MRTVGTATALTCILLIPCVFAQAPPAGDDRARPLYKVTIVSRNVKALNYGHLTAATRIGFAGTPLLPAARGEAKVEPGRGATLIRASFSNMLPPQRFGAQYLTYVVWAISSDGRAQNLGELSLDGSNKGKLQTSTPLQAFAMIVTAEPYYSVTQPSDVVVMENVLIPGTIGKVEEVNATYELLPRKEFTWNAAPQSAATGKLVSREEYDAITAIYQAQNAIQIAEAENAQKYAPETLARARSLYEQAKRYPANLSTEIVSIARQAAQIAEDSRLIASKRAAAERAAAEEQQRAAEARKAAEQAEDERSRTEPARVAPPPPQPKPQAMMAPERTRTEAVRVASPPPVQQAASAPVTKPPVEVDPAQFVHTTPQASENRRALIAAVRGTFPVNDLPKGVIITLPAVVANSSTLSRHLTHVAQALRAYPDLHVNVDGHTDIAGDVSRTQREAEAVRSALIAAGVPVAKIVARGYGSERPVASNASPSGRAANRRIEIVIAGDAIGLLPTWDKTYRLTPPAAAARR
jgi:hypothetical protein